MKLDKEGFDLLVSFEKVSYRAYKDNKGYSCGIGHYILPNEKWLLTATLTHTQVMALFNKDSAVMQKELNNLLQKHKITLSQRQYSSLFSLYFNCGMTKVLASPLFFALKQGNKEKIIEAWMGLDKNIPSIRLRRSAELAFFFS